MLNKSNYKCPKYMNIKNTSFPQMPRPPKNASHTIIEQMPETETIRDNFN